MHQTPRLSEQETSFEGRNCDGEGFCDESNEADSARQLATPSSRDSNSLLSFLSILGANGTFRFAAQSTHCSPTVTLSCPANP